MKTRTGRPPRVSRVRAVLAVVAVGVVVALVSARGVAGLYTAVFEDKHFTLPNDYFLGIETKEDPRALAQLVENPDEFKLMPKSMA